MTSKADKLPLDTEPVAYDNNKILTLKPGDQTFSHLTQLKIVVYSYFNLGCRIKVLSLKTRLNGNMGTS